MTSITNLFEKNSILYQNLINFDNSKKLEDENYKKYLFRNTIDRYKINKENHKIEKHKGDEYIDTINLWLNKLYRSPGQKEFHQMFLSTCLRLIYGDDYEKERHRIMKKYNFTNKKQQTLICAPRRFGKTFAVSYFAIVMAIVLPNVEISIFSPGRRQSVALMNHIFHFMKRLNQDDRIIRKNEEKMILRSLNGEESKINAYPSAIKTLKGVSGSILILEELAALDPAVLYEVVIPIFQLDITSFIGISTITTDNNFFTKYLKMKDKNGDSLFATKYIYLACEVCRKKNEAHKCNHNAFLLPNWSSERKQRAVKSLMSEREDMISREIGGVANSKYGKAFLKKYITSLEEKKRYEIDRNIDYSVLFISVDPNSGGESHFAILTILVQYGIYIIIGAESYPSKTARENHSILIEHVNKLDENDLYNNTLKVFILESNLGFESEHFSEIIKNNIRNFCILQEKENSNRVGFITTNSMKKLAVEKLRLKLSEDSIAISCENDFICNTQNYNTIISMLMTQLSEFSEIIKEPEFKKATTIYSGKLYGCDDLVMTLLFNIMWIPFFYNDERYSHLI